MAHSMKLTVAAAAGALALSYAVLAPTDAFALPPVPGQPSCHFTTEGCPWTDPPGGGGGGGGGGGNEPGPEPQADVVWIDSNGPVPPYAYPTGYEYGNYLRTCRAIINGTYHVGKLLNDTYCHIGYGGGERLMQPYQALGGDEGRWVAASNGHVPSGALAGGSEYGYSLYVCRAEHNGSVQPGKLIPGDGCHIGYGGDELKFSSYEVMLRP